MDVKGNNEIAVKFLKDMFPKGPWLLVSIDPEDRAKMEVGYFTPQTVKDAESFLGRHQGKHNIYFHVNPVMRSMGKKAKREDIKEVVQFHVDIDAPKKPGTDLDAELKKLQGQLFEGRPKAIPEPTFVVYSGGGFQAFWKLKEPIPINGDLAAAEDAKRYNQQLETVFKADHCHNIDRLMRLPGTVNVPDAKKRTAGRPKVMATLIHSNLKNVYELKKFTPAPEVGTHSGGLNGTTPGEVRIDQGNIERIDMDYLKATYGVPDHIRTMIVQGDLTDEQKAKKDGEGKDTSRSAILFEVVCGLVRAEVPDQEIYAIITDSTLGIGDSVLFHKSGKRLSPQAAHAYAVRQITRAHEFTFNPDLADMNNKHAVIGNAGGKCQVIEEVWDEVMQRHMLTFQSFADIKNRYNNQKVQVGTHPKTGEPVYAPKGQWWLDQEKRRQYDTIVFRPDREVGGAYNLWRGWAYSAMPGDKHERYLEHLRENICGGVESHFQYLIRWMARAVQFPALNGQVAIVLRGARGAGKSQFVEHFGKLFGRHYLHTAESSHLVGHFNQHLRDCLLLFGDEAFFAGDKKHESVLKTLVTEKTMMYEKKGHDATPGPNYIRLVLASNSDWVVPAGAHERRFFVLDVGDGRRQDTAYFGAMKKEMEEGGYESLLHYLLNVDLTDYNVWDFPKTEALRDQQSRSLDPEDDWWLSKLQDGTIFGDDEGWRSEVVVPMLYSNYRRYIKGLPRANVLSMNAWSRWFQKRVTNGEKSQQRYSHPVNFMDHDNNEQSIKSPSVYVLPTLDVARLRWEETFGERDWTMKVRYAKDPEQADIPF